jgi:hypothetical protein
MVHPLSLVSGYIGEYLLPARSTDNVSVAGMLLAQRALSSIVRRKKLLGDSDDLFEHAMLIGQLVFYATVTLAGQLAGIL